MAHSLITAARFWRRRFLRHRVALLENLGDAGGQTLVEYALILALIAVVVVVVLLTLGGQISSIFNSVSSSI